MDWAALLANPNTGIGFFLLLFVVAMLTGRIYSKKQHQEILDAHKEQQIITEENNKLLRALLEEKSKD
jgi:hypothetical protein